MGKIILFDSIKGGVGKSTLTVQVVVAMVKQAKKVAVMDCDPQNSVNKWVYRRHTGGLEKGFEPLEPNLDFLVESRNSYDYIIVDSAGADTETGRRLLLLADYVVSPLQPTEAALDTVLDHNNIINEAKKHNKKMLSFYVLNDCSTHSKDKEAAESLEMLLQFKKNKEIVSDVVPQLIYSRKILKSSFGKGETCFDSKANKARDEIQSVIDYILEK